MHKHPLLLFILLVWNSCMMGQGIIVVERDREIPISDAMLIQNGKLIGTTNEQGFCTLKGRDIKSKVCIKTFGFVDTCLFWNNELQTVYLRPTRFETDEVNIVATAISKKEQFLQFFEHSISLSHHKSFTNTFRFSMTLNPDSTSYYDKMEGRFSYNHPSTKSRMSFRDLYACDLKNTVSRKFATDSSRRYAMDNGALPIAMMRLYHICTPYYKSYKRRLKEDRFERYATDSTLTFIYTDTVRVPYKLTWTFTKDGRLMSYEDISAMAEGLDAYGRPRGTRYTHIQYSTVGALEAVVVHMLHKYIYKVSEPYNIDIELIKDSSICEEFDNRVPVGASVGVWTKIDHVPSVVVDE